MTDADIIADLQKRALDIMHEPSATVTGEPNKRADRLEIAARYLTCAGILNNEVPYEKLKRLLI